MKKSFAFTAIFLAAAFSSYAQRDSLHIKKFDHYIGVQANQLLKQLINLNNSNTTITNPYLLTYAIHLTENGYGLQIGLGYKYQLTDDRIPVARQTKINESFYRIGVGRKVMLAKRWQLGYGLDYVGDYQVDKTTSSSVTNFGSTTDSSSSVSTSKTTSMGFGPQATLGFYLTKKICISTEVTYYFLKSKIKQNVFSIDNVTQLFVTPPETTSTGSNSNTETEKTTFSFSLPVALFLVVRF